MNQFQDCYEQTHAPLIDYNPRETLSTKALENYMANATEDNPLNQQIGGEHYKKLKIQPMEYSMANGLDACQHTIIKYVTRFRDKGGIQDLEKAKHCIDMLIQFEQGVGK